MAGRLNGWSSGFLRWVSIVGPLLVAIWWVDGRYMTRGEVAQLKEAADETHAELKANQQAMLNEIGGLRFQIFTLNGQLATLNGYLARESGMPLAVPQPPVERRRP